MSPPPRTRRLCILPSDKALGPIEAIPPWIHRLSLVPRLSSTESFRCWYSQWKSQPIDHASINLHKLYSKLNKVAFDSLLPVTCDLRWCNKLNKSSGVTKMIDDDLIILLSRKVLKTHKQLVSTLAHEMCHVGQFAITQIIHPPHGEAFLLWLRRAQLKVPFIEVSITHNYFLS